MTATSTSLFYTPMTMTTSINSFLVSLLLRLTLQCNGRSEIMDKIDISTEDFKNPFREHIVKTISRRDFTPPKQVYFGFKPVKAVSTLLSEEPEVNIDDLDILPGPPYFKEDLEKNLKHQHHATQIFPSDETREVSYRN